MEADSLLNFSITWDAAPNRRGGMGHLAVLAPLVPKAGQVGAGGGAGQWGPGKSFCCSASSSHPLPEGQIISCQSHRQITGNCSSPNYLVLIGD